MWPSTQVTKLLKIALPIIQAPMAGATTPELIAAVSNSGGLGSLAAGYLTADEMRIAIRQIRKLSNKPFAINLFIPEKHYATNKQVDQARKAVQASCEELNYVIDLIKQPYAPPFEEQMAVILEEKIPIFSFTFGLPPDNWIEKFKKNHIKLIGTATTLQEAKMLEEHEIDLIVAQGSEAGGHRGTFIGKAEDGLTNISSLIPLLVDQINIPIIAAGGIMNAQNILSLLTLGASAIQMGTIFLTCTESGIHPLYKKALLTSIHDTTTLTRAFSGKLARGITNKFINRMQTHEATILDYPIQNALTTPMRKEARKQSCIDFMSMWAGQAAYLCKELSAAQLIDELQHEVMLILKNNPLDKYE